MMVQSRVQFEEVRSEMQESVVSPGPGTSNRSGSPPPNQSPSRRRRHRHEDDFVTSTTPKHVRNIVMAMLKNRQFVGVYKETRYIESLHDYRDIIEVEERDEVIPIINDLQQRLRLAFPQCWIGYTMPKSKSVQSPDGHCFWVELVDKVYEPYHFRITNIVFGEKEICCVIKTERKVVPDVTERQADFYEMINNSKNALKQSSITFFIATWQLLTLDNFKNSITFLFMLICTLGTAGVYCAEWSLRFLREISNLIKVATPVMLSILDIVKKTIGAVFILLATVWRDLMGNNHRNRQQESARTFPFLKFR